MHMKITKFDHSCLLVEEGGARILIDPGSDLYAKVPDDLKNIDAILITHEHQDHYFPEKLKKLIANNPGVALYGNQSIVELAKKENIAVQLLGGQQETVVKGITVRGWGEWHAENHTCMESPHNTGYFIGDRFFYPGDTLTVPDKPVEILAYPAVAPWMKIAESLEYLKAVKPKFAFPVHDGFLKFGGPYYAHPERHAEEWGIEWVVLETGAAREF